jgi:hypothetical protein
VPGGVGFAGNTQKELVVNFTTPVSTSRVLLLITDNGAQTVARTRDFAGVGGHREFSIGTSVTLAEHDDAKADDLGDNWWKLRNRHSVRRAHGECRGRGRGAHLYAGDGAAISSALQHRQRHVSHPPIARRANVSKRRMPGVRRATAAGAGRLQTRSRISSGASWTKAAATANM